MKRQLASAVSSQTYGESGAVTSVATQPEVVFAEDAQTKPVWHTLIPTGELDRASAHTLEAEIERLCEEGVAGITLDLRGLTYIDSVGVAVIAFRCGLCQRRGCGFALIPGSRLVHRAFEHAGVTGLLPFQEDDVAPAQSPAFVLSRRGLEECEQ
jgi:anti-anti-sigma factor